MKKGYVKLYRKIMDTSFYKNPNCCHLAIHLLLKANNDERDVFHNKRPVKLLKGQTITGRGVLTEETGLTSQNVRTCLKKLEKVGFLTSKSTNRYSIITVLNYNEYQKTNQRTNQQHLKNQPTESVKTNHKQEGVKVQYNTSTPDHFSNFQLKTEQITQLQTEFKYFKDMRKKIRKGLTDHAENLAIKKLYALSEGNFAIAMKILQRSIFSSWQGLYPLPESEIPKTEHIDTRSVAEKRCEEEWNKLLPEEQKKKQLEANMMLEKAFIKGLPEKKNG